MALFCFLLLSNSGPAHAASVSARDVNAALWSGQSLDVKYSAQAKFPANDPRYKVVPIKYTPSQIIKRAKNIAQANPGAVAVRAAALGALAAAGWVINDLTGQVSVLGDPAFNPALVSHCESFISGYSFLDYHSMVNHGLVNAGTQYHVTCTGVRNSGQSAGGLVDFEVYPYVSSLQPVQVMELVSDEQLADALGGVLSSMSPSDLRDFFKDGGYLPELTPELNAALQDWANELGVDPEVEEAVESNVAKDVLDVRVTDPVAIDGSDIKSEIPESLWKYTGDVFRKTEDTINDVASDGFSVPGISFVPDLPEHSVACKQITISYFGSSTTVPGPQGCSAFDSLKDMLGYFFYVLTAFTCVQVLFGPRSV